MGEPVTSGAAAGAAASGLGLPAAGAMLSGVALVALIVFVSYKFIKESKPGQKAEMAVDTPHGKANLTLENHGRVIEFLGGKDCKLTCNDNVLRDPKMAEELRKTLQAFAALVAIQAGGVAISQTVCADTGRVIMGTTYQVNGELHKISDISKFLGEAFPGTTTQTTGKDV